MGLCDLCFNTGVWFADDATHVINIVLPTGTIDVLEVCDKHYEDYVADMELKNASR